MINYLARLVACIVVLTVSQLVYGQHLADAEFDASVAKPSYQKSGPRVMFDEAHFNYHTMADRFKPFVDLLTNDGYRVVRNREPFTKKSLSTFKILVIVNPLGADIDDADAEKPALTTEEIALINEWVRDGGSLLLAVDVGPFANATATLAAQFGVEMTGKLVKDAANAESQGRSDLIVFSTENKLLLGHPITQGRSADETLKRVICFSGQALKGPESAAVLLKLTDTATEVVDEPSAGNGSVPKNSIAGRSQGLAFKAGSGRVVVLADAEMLSALLGEPPAKEPIGMNYPESNNRQFTLNVLHWLSGLLGER
jgi:hypothetical protein